MYTRIQRRHCKRGCWVRQTFYLLTGISLMLWALCIWVILVHIFREHRAMYFTRNTNTTPKQPAIPRTIHQIWINFNQGSKYDTKPPDLYQTYASLTRSLNTDYKYKLWNETDVLNLLKTDFYWLIDTYHGYVYDVQRTDMARYLILYKYGGIYIDMDDQAIAPLHQLIVYKHLEQFDTTFFCGLPSGLSTNIIISKAGTSFFRYLISELPSHNHWYGLPYFTVMWGTGPRFLTDRFMEYQQKNSVFVFDRTTTELYFKIGQRKSWQHLDGSLISAGYPLLKYGRSLVCVIVLLSIVVFVCGLLLVKSRKSSKRRYSG